MDGVERHGDININVGFGTITFYRDGAGSYAIALAEFTIKPGKDERNSKVEVLMRLGCSPEKESIIDVVQSSRQLATHLLRAAADHLEAETIEDLIFRQEPAKQ